MRWYFSLFLLVPFFGLSQHKEVDSTELGDIRRVQLHEDIVRLKERLKEQSFSTLDALEKWVESNQQFDHRLKYKYLMGIKYFLEDLQSGKVHKKYSQNLVDAYQYLMEHDMVGNSIEMAVQKFDYEINNALIGDKTIFYENVGLRAARMYMYSQFLRIHPEKILTTISGYLEEPFVDEMLAQAAQLYPDEFYNYASAKQSLLAKRMRQVKDTTVQLLCRISEDSSGRLLFPFLHAMLYDEINYDTIKQISIDDKKFYQLLVRSHIHYQEEIVKGNPPVVYQEMFKLLKKKAVAYFINPINGMHDENELLRFKLLDGLTPEELYYLMVVSEDIIYTSSFVGIFQRMMDGLQNQNTNQLLENVHFDRFRKFIKMAADYNKLDEFMNDMQPSQAQLLIKNFVARLEYDPNLENAVDVANGFSSIINLEIKQIIAEEIHAKLLEVQNTENEAGIRVYEALESLLKAEKDSGKAFSGKYELDPPYFLKKEKLSPNNRFIEQLFFYGDKDGKASFNHFIAFFRNNKNWKVIKSEQWYEIKSMQGAQISMFANIPFDNADGEDLDALAQASLTAFLNKNQLQPSIIVHRGHSYHLPSTIAQMSDNAKLVILGSCGSYQHLHDVLNMCPTAQIISSREVGSLSVNDPILRTINEQLRTGKDLDWVKIWKKLTLEMKATATKNRFENYVAPHKNLGLMLLHALHNN